MPIFDPDGDAIAYCATARAATRQSRPCRSRCNPSTGAFCQRCGAYRGSLGLEPTYQLYIDHLLAVLREVRRVLRPDGSLWLNLGDCYATGCGKARDAHVHKLMVEVQQLLKPRSILRKPDLLERVRAVGVRVM